MGESNEAAETAAAQPLTALQQLGDLLLRHDIYIEDMLPERLQNVLPLLMEHGEDREQVVARENSLDSPAVVSAIETSIFDRAIRSLVAASSQLPGSEEVQRLRELRQSEDRLVSSLPAPGRRPKPKPAPAAAPPPQNDDPPPPPSPPPPSPSLPPPPPREEDTSVIRQGTQPSEARWRPGELRGVIQQIGRMMAARGDDIENPILKASATQQKAYKCLLNPDLGVEEIANELGYENTGHVSKVAARVLGTFVANIPPEVLKLDELRQAVAGPLPERPAYADQAGVGKDLDAILDRKYSGDKTATVEQLAKWCGRGRRAIWRFLSGESLASEDLLINIMDYLELDPDQKAKFTAAYREEKQLRQKKKPE